MASAARPVSVRLDLNFIIVNPVLRVKKINRSYYMKESGSRRRGFLQRSADIGVEEFASTRLEVRLWSF